MHARTSPVAFMCMEAIRRDTRPTPHLVVLQQRQVARVRLEVRRQALRVQQLQPQLLGARLRRGGSGSVRVFPLSSSARPAKTREYKILLSSSTVCSAAGCAHNVLRRTNTAAAQQQSS